MAILEKIFHRRSGSHPTRKLVLLHGLMGFSANWQKIVRAFEDEYEVLVYDQRGHGRSFHPESGFMPEDYALDLLHIIDELGWPRIDLVGHSMGGRNALHFASRWPGRLGRLVIEDIRPDNDPKSAKSLRDLILSIPVPFKSRDEMKGFFSTRFLELNSHRRAPQALAQYLMANLETTEKGIGWRFSVKGVLDSIEGGRSVDRWREWDTLSMPTLLVRGAESDDLPQAVFDEMLKRQPNATGAVIEKAGHWVHSDQPERFAEALKEFLIADRSFDF